MAPLLHRAAIISHPYRLLISDERLSHVVRQPCLTETDRYLSVWCIVAKRLDGLGCHLVWR